MHLLIALVKERKGLRKGTFVETETVKQTACLPEQSEQSNSKSKGPKSKERKSKEPKSKHGSSSGPAENPAVSLSEVCPWPHGSAPARELCAGEPAPEAKTCFIFEVTLDESEGLLFTSFAAAGFDSELDVWIIWTHTHCMYESSDSIINLESEINRAQSQIDR